MSSMRLEEHWDGVYKTKPTKEVSWFSPHLDISLMLFRETGVAADAPIIDVGSSTACDVGSTAREAVWQLWATSARSPAQLTFQSSTLRLTADR